MDASDETDDQAVARLRATAHPVRLRILSLLTAEAMSAADIARALDITHANASYHLRLLYNIGELVVESEERIRGGRAKRYRYDATRAVPDRTSRTDDRVAYVGEALGYWLWAVLWPDTAGLVVQDHMSLVDLRDSGHPLDLPFGAPSPRLT